MGGPTSCPVQGQCKASGVVYQATVTELPSGKKETYTGVTGRAFKDRLYEHWTDANTALSTHIWSLKDKNSDYEVTWKLKYRGEEV